MTKERDIFRCGACHLDYSTETTTYFCVDCGLLKCPSCKSGTIGCPCHIEQLEWTVYGSPYFIGGEISKEPNCERILNRLKRHKRPPILMSPAAMSCGRCDGFTCIDAYTRNSKLCNLDGFHPTRAYKYVKKLSDMVFLILLIRNHYDGTIPTKLPTDIIYMIVHYATK